LTRTSQRLDAAKPPQYAFTDRLLPEQGTGSKIRSSAWFETEERLSAGELPPACPKNRDARSSYFWSVRAAAIVRCPTNTSGCWMHFGGWTR